MEVYLPYIVTILCAVISGFASYSASRKQSKADIQKLQKQHELDIEKERELFKIEKEKMEIQHKYELELKQKELENAIGGSVVNTVFSKAMESPEIQRQINSSMNNKNHKKKRK